MAAYINYRNELIDIVKPFLCRLQALLISKLPMGVKANHMQTLCHGNSRKEFLFVSKNLQAALTLSIIFLAALQTSK